MITDLRITLAKFNAVVVSVLFLGSVATVHAAEIKLSGAEEVPAVQTAAFGKGNIVVAADKSVSGSVTTTGIVGTMAHIHIGARGKAGPVAIPLSKSADNVWNVPSGAKLTSAQYKSYKTGDLYVNVHSVAYKEGEIRGQIKP